MDVACGQQMDFVLTPAVISTVAGLADLVIPAGDMDALASLLTNQLAMAAEVRLLDLGETPPITTLDPRWL